MAGDPWKPQKIGPDSLSAPVPNHVQVHENLKDMVASLSTALKEQGKVRSNVCICVSKCWLEM